MSSAGTYAASGLKGYSTSPPHFCNKTVASPFLTNLLQHIRSPPQVQHPRLQLFVRHALAFSSSEPSFQQQNRKDDLILRLCDKSVGGGRLVPPGGWQNTDGLVVARKAVDTGLDENETELAVLVFAVALQVLADSDSLEQKSSACMS